MTIQTQRPETDLWLPTPGPTEVWDPHTVHTYYFGFSVPEAGIGAVMYWRFQPAFPLVGGGIGIYQGTENVRPLDVEHLNWWMTMPWPSYDDTNTLHTANGLTLQVVEPGRRFRIRYESPDGKTKVDIDQTAITPLTARGSLMPSLEKDSDPALAPGGSEQFMRVTGELTLNGRRYDVDCTNIRDRSWSQQRPESQGVVALPPLGWTPICFGPDFAFNGFSFETADTGPAWTGLFDIPEGAPSHQGQPYLIVGSELREVTSIRRDVHEYHPHTFQAVHQTVDITDETGAEHRLVGRAIASASLPMWHNIAFVDSVFRWESEDGRITHNSYQEAWFDTYQRARSASVRAGRHALP
ncbi:DUF7064 domain-containing protein [Mycolicibacterium sp. A43C]